MPAAPTTRAVRRQLWRLALDDFPLYLWGRGQFRGFAKTLDEHDNAHPIKPFPDRPHLHTINELYEQSQRLVVMKSRQMVVSWFFCSRFLWECYKPGRRFLVTCKREDDSDALLERMWVQHQQNPSDLTPPVKRKEANLIFSHPGGVESRIQAAAQNSDAPRSFTFTGIWIDEACFTDNVADLITSAGPTTMAGGKVVLTSTPVGRDPVYDVFTDNRRIDL